MGTVSLTTIVSCEAEDESSLLSLVEFDDKIGFSFEFELAELFTFDNDDEHFCRLFMCFKSWSTIFNSFDKDSMA